MSWNMKFKIQLINENYRYRYNTQIKFYHTFTIIYKYEPIYFVLSFNDIFFYRYKNITTYILKN